jgi:hypothetical protein
VLTPNKHTKDLRRDADARNHRLILELNHESIE